MDNNNEVSERAPRVRVLQAFVTNEDPVEEETRGEITILILSPVSPASQRSLIVEPTVRSRRASISLARSCAAARRIKTILSSKITKDKIPTPTRPNRPASLFLETPDPQPIFMEGPTLPSQQARQSAGSSSHLFGYTCYPMRNLGLQCDLNLPPRSILSHYTEPDPAVSTVPSTPTSPRGGPTRPNNIVKIWFANKDTGEEIGRAEIEVDPEYYEFGLVVVKLSKKDKERMEGVVTWRCYFPLNKKGKLKEKLMEVEMEERRRLEDGRRVEDERHDGRRRSVVLRTLLCRCADTD